MARKTDLVPQRQREHSIHRFKIFRGCPFAYRKIVIEKVPQVIALESMKDGKLLHDMVAGYLLHLLGAGLRSDFDWVQSNIPPEASFAVRRTWAKWTSTYLLPPAVTRPLVEGRIALDRDFDFCADFFKAPRLFFRLVIDWAFLQDTLGVVTDWKSNAIMVENILEDEQMMIYAWVFHKLTRAEEILIRLESLGLGYRVQDYILPSDLAHVPDMIREMADRIENNRKWDPTPGSYCGLCGVGAHCPEMSQALIEREYLAPASVADAKKLASLLLRLDNLRDFLGNRLKAWTSEQGPIEVGDMIFGPVPSSKPLLVPEDIADLLLREGVSREHIWKALSMSKTNLSRVIKSRAVKRKDLLEAILAMVPNRESEMFKFYKRPKLEHDELLKP